jgi:acetyl esterase
MTYRQQRRYCAGAPVTAAAQTRVLYSEGLNNGGIQMERPHYDIDATAYSNQIDPSAERLLHDIKTQGFPGWAFLTIAQARAMIAGVRPLAGDPEPVAQIYDVRIPADPEIPVRVYLPDGERPMPVVVYFHGGGWIAGDCNDSDTPVRSLANRSGCAVISVDYRLAPEHKYPSALDDAYNAVQWSSREGERFGWDGRKLAIAGDSAGGNLAAAVALRSRDENGPAIRLQVLVYPVLDHDYDNRSYGQFGTSWGVLTRADMVWFHCHYLSHPDQLDLPYVSPTRCADLSRLPEAILVLPEADPLRDEGLNYARQLREAGVVVEARVYPGMIHGFWQFGGVLQQGRQAIDDVAGSLRSCFSRNG